MNYIDMNHLKTLCRGDNLFLLKTIDAFTHQVMETVPKIEDSFRRKQWKEILSEVHKMRSGADLMGLKILKITLLKIEEECAKQKLNYYYLLIRIKHLKDICANIIQEFELEKQNLKKETLA